MRRATLVCAVSALAVIGTIVPIAHAHAAASPDESLPDLWSGVWPAQLMEPTGNTPLGTLTWRPLRYEEGLALVGKNFGGRAFTGCPADGKTRFFRGHYVEGGDLIACTKGDDARVLVGRFNGREDFRSGSFEVRLVADGPRLFVGEYFEDDGITTKWCGTLERPLVAPDAAPADTADTAAPRLRLVTTRTVAAGRPALIKLRVQDASPAARVDLSILKGSTPVTRISIPAVRTDGRPHVLRWTPPRKLKGALRVCAAALDEAGNATPRTCSPLTVT